MELNRSVLIAQAINFLIILWLFKWLVGDKLATMIATRREELKKAEGANKIYEDIIHKAEAEKKALIDEAVAHKNSVIAQAEQAATLKADKIIADAGTRADNIASEAQEKAWRVEKELEENFIDGVKRTAHTVVKKLFDKDVSLQEEYLVELAKEFSK
jgi:F0F1-type ATP synthase membrane subunit b/b'